MFYRLKRCDPTLSERRAHQDFTRTRKTALLPEIVQETTLLVQNADIPLKEPPID